MKWRNLQKWAFALFIGIVASSILIYLYFGDNLSIENLREGINDFGIWAPIIFIFLYVVGTIFIPSTPFMAVAGILFGFKYGLLYTTIGGFLSSLIVFEISRRLGRDWVESILKKQYMRVFDGYNKRLERGAVWDLIALRVAPIMPFNVLNILMGISRIKISDYVVGTLIGLAPSNLLAVYFGTFITKIF